MMTYTQQPTALSVGIDVSKETLAVATYPTHQVKVIPNDADHCEALAEQLAQQPVQLVLLEGSGGFEKPLVHALQQAGVRMAIVPPQRARYFAKSLRGNLKTDRVDARQLARFASCYPAPEATEVPAVQAPLKELWARREQLVQALEAEKKRLQVATHPLVRASLERTIAVLHEELAHAPVSLDKKNLRVGILSLSRTAHQQLATGGRHGTHEEALDWYTFSSQLGTWRLCARRALEPHTARADPPRRTRPRTPPRTQAPTG